jgi:uracil-DNA glycosylase
VQGDPVRLPSGRLAVPQYHPAAALYNPALVDLVEAHFARLREMLEENEKVVLANA